MRFVWLVTALLLLAAAAAAFWPRGASGGAPTSGLAAEGNALRASPDAKALPAAAPEQTPEAPAPPLVASATPTTTASPGALPAPASPSALDSLLGGTLAPAATGASTDTPTLTVGASAKVERIDGETVRLDGRYTLRGRGTEGDPYQVTWELLGSAHESVDATTARYVLPGRIADLRGAWVQISGYWAPPLQVFEAKELMVMLNKWDGCCVGLPPTPFDSIEATLAAPVAVKGQHLFRYGTIKGRLEIEPFVAGSFLLGLYRLQDAVLETSS